MATKRCAYGFSCAAMMMQPGLLTEDCPNKDECGTIMQLSEEEVAELRMARIERNRRIVEEVSVTPSEAARILLNSRGCPQTPESLGIVESIANLKQLIAEAEAKLEDMGDKYIPPPGVEVHRYAVKRPYDTYYYNKFTSKTAVFPPQEKEHNVKVLHLSKDADPRNIKGRLGIERRNQILALKTQIDNAVRLINQSLDGVSEDLAQDKLAEKFNL